jgi:hypothetical protein
MKVMVSIKANPSSEAGYMPSEKLLTEMGLFNEKLVKAGIMLAGEGLHPSSKRKRVSFKKGGTTTVVDGPFTESKELIAGFWIWNVKSMEEAVEWARRIPNTDDQDGEVELAPVFEAEDFGAEFTPEARAREERLRKEMESRHS